MQRVLGYWPEDRIGKNIFRDPIVHPDDMGWKRAFFDELLSCLVMLVTVEFRLRHVDGSWWDIEVIGNNFLDESSVGGFVTNYWEVTDRRRVHEELCRAQNKLKLQIKE